MEAKAAQLTPPHPTEAHYDIDVSFFQSFLDNHLKYTCGLFETPKQDLDEASVRMLDYLIDLANLREGARVLEIGSGWGSILKRLRDRNEKVDYVGISPSRQQNDFIRSQHPGTVLHASCFEDLSTLELGQFDAIFLVGSFCHLQEKQLQLARLRSMLRPGGRMVIEDSFFLTQALYQQHARDPRTEYLQKSVFGYAEIPAVASFFDMLTDAGLKVLSVLDTTESYRLTIDQWLNRLEQAPARYRIQKQQFTAYLKIAQAGWNYTTCNYVVALDALPRRGH